MLNLKDAIHLRECAPLIQDISKYFLENFPELHIEGAYIYGSACNAKSFNYPYSDVDIIFYSRDFEFIDKQLLIQKLKRCNENFGEKSPCFLQDYLGARIELYIIKDVKFDITITNSLLPSREALIENAWHDNFESILGNIFLNSICIFGNICEYDYFQQNYYPFYDDDLRIKRMRLMYKRIQHIKNTIKSLIDRDLIHASEYVFLSRTQVIRYLHMYERKYCHNPAKDLESQVNELYCLCDMDKATLLLQGGDISNITKRYIDLLERILEWTNLE